MHASIHDILGLDGDFDDNLQKILGASFMSTTSLDLDLAFGAVRSNVDLARTHLLCPPSSPSLPLPSPPSFAAAGEPFWDPRVLLSSSSFSPIGGCLDINFSLSLSLGLDPLIEFPQVKVALEKAQLLFFPDKLWDIVGGLPAFQKMLQISEVYKAAQEVYENAFAACQSSSATSSSDIICCKGKEKTPLPTVTFGCTRPRFCFVNWWSGGCGWPSCTTWRQHLQPLPNVTQWFLCHLKSGSAIWKCQGAICYTIGKLQQTYYRPAQD